MVIGGNKEDNSNKEDIESRVVNMTNAKTWSPGMERGGQDPADSRGARSPTFADPRLA
jgi:hypothetical protein